MQTGAKTAISLMREQAQNGDPRAVERYERYQELCGEWLEQMDAIIRDIDTLKQGVSLGSGLADELLKDIINRAAEILSADHLDCVWIPMGERSHRPLEQVRSACIGLSRGDIPPERLIREAERMKWDIEPVMEDFDNTHMK